ncbi:MAG: hydrogenase subunit MbhD domain-containing protein [bacterium]
MDILLLGHIILLLFLIVTALATIVSKDLLKSVIIFGAYSFTIAITYSLLRVVDVAMTEAAVGAGISCILFIAAIMKTRRWEE